MKFWVLQEANWYREGKEGAFAIAGGNGGIAKCIGMLLEEFLKL
jgi:hypothetical protein